MIVQMFKLLTVLITTGLARYVYIGTSFIQILEQDNNTIIHYYYQLLLYHDYSNIRLQKELQVFNYNAI